MDTIAVQLLILGAIEALRQDGAIARQGVMNHQTSAHFMDMSFIRDAMEMSIPESAAVQGLTAARIPSEAMGLNTAHMTPSTAGTE